MLKPYDAYKCDDISWTSNIPKHWTMEKIGLHFSERRCKVSDKDYPPLSVSKKGIVPQLTTAAKSKDGDNRKLVLNGDFAINSRSDRKGSSGTSSYDGSVSLINIVLSPRDSISPYFSHYLLRCHPFIEEYYRNGRGIVADLWTTRYTEMRNILIPIPPREEQDQIVRYLDWKLSQINRLIKAKKKQIALLKEQQQAVINQAVTKGLDPNVEMKDSGIEWIGEIPLEWVQRRIKSVCKINPSVIDDIKNLSDDEELVFLPMENISSEGEINNSIKRKLKDVKTGFTSFAKNDVVIAKITPCFENGKGACLNTLETKIGFGTTELIVLRANQLILPEYLYLITSSSIFRILGEKMMTGSAGQKRISTDFVSNFSLGIAEIQEQRAILDGVSKIKDKINKNVVLLKTEISLITEYRTRLISDVVTGKVDVRGIEIPDYEPENEDVLEDDETLDDTEELDPAED